MEFKIGQRVQLVSRQRGEITHLGESGAVTIKLNNNHRRSTNIALIEWAELEAKDLFVGAIIESPVNSSPERITRHIISATGDFTAFEVIGLESKLVPSTSKFWTLNATEAADTDREWAAISGTPYQGEKSH